MFRPHWFCPRLQRVLSQSTLLSLQAALQGVGPELRALPRPKLLRFRFLDTAQRHRLSWACILYLPRPRSSGSQNLDEHTLPSVVRLIPSMVPTSFPGVLVWCALCLFWELDSICDPPSGC